MSTFGALGARLMERAGRPLDAWQRDALDLMLAVREDGRWACAECCEWVPRQNGKGGILEARALTGFFLLGENLIMWSAHEYKTAAEAFRRVKALIRKLGRQVGNDEDLIDVDGIHVRIKNGNTEKSFERLDTGARIIFIARSKSSGRGFSGDLNIIDESFAYTSEQQEALLYTASAINDPQFIFTSSPPLTGETGEIMYQLRHRGDPTAPRRPEDGPWTQDPSLSYRDWGLGGDLDNLAGVDLDDVANHSAANPARNIRIRDETIARERRASLANPAGFARERLGIWPRQISDDIPSWQVISEAAWTAALHPTSQVDGRPAFGVYVPPDRSYAAIGIAGASTLGGRHIELSGTRVDGAPDWDYRPGTGWVVARLVEMNSRWNPSVIVIDDKALADDAEKAGLVVHRANLGDVVTGCQLLYDGVAGADVASRDIKHIGQEDPDTGSKPLTEAVAGAAKRDIGGSWAWARRDLAVDVTPLAATSLALFGHCTRRVHRPDQLVPLVAWR